MHALGHVAAARVKATWKWPEVVRIGPPRCPYTNGLWPVSISKKLSKTSARSGTTAPNHRDAESFDYDLLTLQPFSRFASLFCVRMFERMVWLPRYDFEHPTHSFTCLEISRLFSALTSRHRQHPPRAKALLSSARSCATSCRSAACGTHIL